MTESLHGRHEHLKFRDTPDDLLDALRFASQEDRLRLLDPALWRSLETIIHNQRVLYRMLEHLLGRTSEVVTDLSVIANAVANETTVEQSAIALMQQLSSQLLANAGDPAAVQQLAQQINANANALAQAVTANTPAAPSTPPPTGDGPTGSATPPVGDVPADSGTASSGSVDLSGSGSTSGGDPAPAPSDSGATDAGAGAATTTADITTSSGQTDGSVPSLPVYQHVGSNPVDTAEWVLVTGIQDSNGDPLYNYVGDTPGGGPTGASADWQVYTGPTQGQTGGQVDTSSGVPHTPIDTTGAGA